MAESIGQEKVNFFTYSYIFHTGTVTIKALFGNTVFGDTQFAEINEHIQINRYVSLLLNVTAVYCMERSNSRSKEVRERIKYDDISF